MKPAISGDSDSIGRATEPILKVRRLRTYLYTKWGVTKAVDDVSFEVRPGETLGIVGESGSGKSMLALSLVRLPPRPAGRIVGGEVLLDGVNLLRLSEPDMREIRGRKISMILQDPHQSLNPVYTVGNQLAEAVRTHARGLGSQEVERRATEALRLVRVPDPQRRLRNYPHELSGGMKQRVVGAMAMAYRPLVLIADEPTTALDVTIQAQYLMLLRRLQDDSGAAIILITHDFSVVAAMCDRVAVMYAGRIVEQGPVEQIFDSPRHPYTRALMASLPRMEAKAETLTSIEGQPPSLVDLPPGCHFSPRCSFALARCRVEYPPEFRIGQDHTASCWRVGEDLWPLTN